MTTDQVTRGIEKAPLEEVVTSITVNVHIPTITFCSLVMPCQSTVSQNNSSYCIIFYGLCGSGIWKVNGYVFLTRVMSGGCCRTWLELEKQEIRIDGGWPDISLSFCVVSLHGLLWVSN